MGQASCVEMAQAIPLSAGRLSTFPTDAKPPSDGKVTAMPLHAHAVSSGTPQRRTSSAFEAEAIGATPQKASRRSSGDRILEPNEIRRLRFELQAKERALEALRREATDHVTLLETLEREAARRQEAALRRAQKAEGAASEWSSAAEALRKAEPVGWEAAYVASLVEELKAHDVDIAALGRAAAADAASAVAALNAEDPAAPSQFLASGGDEAPKVPYGGPAAAAAVPRKDEDEAEASPGEKPASSSAAALKEPLVLPIVSGSALPRNGGDETPVHSGETPLHRGAGADLSVALGECGSGGREFEGLGSPARSEDEWAARLVLRRVFRSALAESCRRRGEAVPTDFEQFDIALLRKVDARAPRRETQELARILEARRRVSEGLPPLAVEAVTEAAEVDG